MRPHQWVKNLFVLLPVVFAKGLLDLPRLGPSLGAFGAFCLASSAVYVLNDLRDVEADRAHPKKRSRPIASGEVSETSARKLIWVLAASALALASVARPEVSLVVLGYLLLNVAYTLWLKRIAYVDVLCIAAGFELRVLAGTVAAAVPASHYLLLETFALASFLGFGKRMHELIVSEQAVKQRAALEGYGKRLLTGLLVVNAIVAGVVYVAYTLDPSTRANFGTDHLVYTSVFTLFGITRFVRLVTGRPEAESPTDEMLRDRWFLANLVAWAIAVVLVIYLGR